MSGLRFADPWYLLLLLPLLVGLALTYRQVHGMQHARKRFAFAVRAVMMAALILALAGPEALRPNKGVCTIFVLDRSDSIRDADRKNELAFLNQSLSAMGPDDQAALVVFGSEPMIDQAPGKLRPIQQLLSVVDASGSDLASAIRLAGAAFPDGKSRRLVVLSDGNETSGDAAEAALVASSDGIQIDTVTIGVDPKIREASVVDVQMPSEIREGEPFDVKVDIESTAPMSGTLILDRDGVPVHREHVQLRSGPNSILVRQVLDSTGFQRYRAVLEADADTDARNNTGMGFVNVKGRPRILVLQSDTKRQELARALREQGLLVDLSGPASVPTSPEELQNYEAVLLNDINASSITIAQMRMMQSAVRDAGIGLAMIGGEDSFLPGGYFSTPIAEALPVDLNVRQRKSFPSTSIIIVADMSGSMSILEDGIPKYKLAAKAAEQTIQMLSPLDRAGVAGSTDAIEFVAPMQLLTDKGKFVAELEQLRPGGGGIYVRPSLEFAQRHLANEPSKVRHLILLADGNDCDDQDNCLEIASAMRSEKMTISVIAIGDGKDVPFLKLLAAAGGGQFYLALQASQLPAIFTQDAAIMSRSAIEEGAFIPKVSIGDEILRGVDLDSMPPLLAYCLTDTRPLSRVGMRTGKDDPLLAVWQYGLGSSLAFTSDAQSKWASRWIPWSGFAKFWAQAVRSISRRTSSNSFSVETSQVGGKGQLKLVARDPSGKAIDNLRAKVRVSTPRGDFLEVPLLQSVPGEYRGTFEAHDLGSYIVTIAEEAGGKPRISTSGFSIAYPAEYRTTRANQPLMSQLAKPTGGKELNKPFDAFRPRSNPGNSVSELWAAFLLLAACLLPLDVGARRLALPVKEMLQKAGQALQRARQNRRISTSVADEPVDRLRAAKQRARSEIPAQPAATQTDNEPRQTLIAEREEAPAQNPAKDPSSVPGSAADRLLEAKRRRRPPSE